LLQIIQKLKDKREERLSNRSFANGCEILGIGVRNVEKEAKLLSFQSLTHKRDKIIKELESLDGVQSVFVAKINTICVVKSGTYKWSVLNDKIIGILIRNLPYDGD